MTDIPTNLSPELEAAFIAKLKEETRKAKAEADKEEQEAINKRIYAENNKRSQDIELASSFNRHEYHFMGEVCYDTVAPCLLTLSRWHYLDEYCPMTIHMDSPGGSAIDGFHLFDQIDRYSIRGKGTHEVTIIVSGEAASMAGILVQAADKRIMGKRAQMMIHQVSAWIGGSTGSLEDAMENLQNLNDQVTDVFMARATGITREEFIGGNPERKIKGWKRNDWYITAERALEYGFIDKVA